LLLLLFHDNGQKQRDISNFDQDLCHGQYSQVEATHHNYFLMITPQLRCPLQLVVVGIFQYETLSVRFQATIPH
jgi:hypothetical protein